MHLLTMLPASPGPAAHGGASPAAIILIILGVLAAWLVSLLLYPFRPCLMCHGSGRRRGSSARRFGECPRCRGKGRVQRPGSRLAHRAVWTVAGERARARQARIDRRAAEDAEHPRRLI